VSDVGGKGRCGVPALDFDPDWLRCSRAVGHGGQHEASREQAEMAWWKTTSTTAGAILELQFRLGVLSRAMIALVGRLLGRWRYGPPAG
jgi:hypothetical protein